MEMIKGALVALDVILILLFAALSLIGAKEKETGISVQMAAIMSVIMLNVGYIMLL